MTFTGGGIVKVIKRAVIKQVLTEKSKDVLFSSLSEQKKQYEMECEQLDFEKRKTLKNNSTNNQSFITSRYDEEIERRKEKIRQLDFQVEQLKLLPLGTEVVEKEIDMLTEINVGDSYHNFLTPAEIVVKDGIIKEIRN